MTGIRHAWDAYWAWVGGNIGALPLEALITAAASALFGLVLRRPLARLGGRLRDALIADVRRDAAAARRIAADTHHHLTGAEHPDAPPPKT